MENTNKSVFAKLIVKEYFDKELYGDNKPTLSDLKKYDTYNICNAEDFIYGLKFFVKSKNLRALATAKFPKVIWDYRVEKLARQIENGNYIDYVSNLYKKPKEQDIKPSDSLYIDGFQLSKAKVFKISIPYIQKRYNEFNKKYFNDELPIVPLELGKRKTCWGCVKSVYSYITYENKVIYLLISTTFSRSECDYCETLLHEMIHVYQLLILKNRGGHGSDFKQKMNEINKFGWEVKTSGDSLDMENASIPDDLVKKYKRHNYIFVYNDGKSTPLLCMTSKDNVYRYSLHKDRITFYEILNLNKDLANLPTCRTSVRGLPKSLDYINNLIKDGFIKPIKLNESLTNNNSKYNRSLDPDIKTLDITNEYIEEEII